MFPMLPAILFEYALRLQVAKRPDASARPGQRSSAAPARATRTDHIIHTSTPSGRDDTFITQAFHQPAPTYEPRETPSREPSPCSSRDTGGGGYSGYSGYSGSSSSDSGYCGGD